jgi:F-type H+-transporting ATPase subunit delta
VMVSSTAVKYARALADVALEQGLAEEARRELRGFGSLHETNEELREALKNPGLPLKVKQEIVREIAGKSSFSGIVLNFLLLLVERNRLGQLAGIVEAYERVLDEKAGVSRIEVFSAHALPEGARRRLAGVMKEQTGGEVRLTYLVDEGLIGGVKLRMGSVVLDGSVRTELENLGRVLSRK